MLVKITNCYVKVVISTSDSIPGDHGLIRCLKYLSIVILCVDHVLVKSAAQGHIVRCNRGMLELVR